MHFPSYSASTLLCVSLVSLVMAGCVGDDSGDSDPTASTTDAMTTTTTTTTTTTDASTTDATDATTTDASTTAETTGTTADGPSFELEVYPILMVKCGCHVDLATNGLDMADAPTAYANLVNVPTMELPTMNRITPGDLANSYLDHKINGTQLDVGGMGVMMPLGDTLLPEQIMAIEDWIVGGAAP